MGNYFSSPTQIPEGRGKKRRYEEISPEDAESEKIQEENLNTPKRKRLKSTTRYIFETLFINGENSDVKIIALGKEWQLHKVYLCQSGYFSSMFRGSWKEAQQDVISMEIPDGNIDTEALDIALGSLYKDDVFIKPTKVISVLAAATLLCLEDLISQCANLMVETVSSKTVSSYHTASCMYGQSFVSSTCMSWLEKNLMSVQSVDLLSEISPTLMAAVVNSPHIFVMQVEMDIYSMLKKWMYLSLHEDWLGSFKDLSTECDEYFKKIATVCFLETTIGQVYKEAFRALRLEHIVNDMSSAKIVEQDKILPKSWLYPVFRNQWTQMLRMEQGLDKGPETDAHSDQLLEVGLRCGRVLKKEGSYCWRWTGYNYGFDLLVSFSSRLIIFKRNTISQSCPGSVSLQNKRHFLYKLTVATFNKLGHTTYHRTTGVKRLSLGKDEEIIVLSIDRKAQFPLHISCNFLIYTPIGVSSESTSTSESHVAGPSPDNGDVEEQHPGLPEEEVAQDGLDHGADEGPLNELVAAANEDMPREDHDQGPYF